MLVRPVDEPAQAALVVNHTYYHREFMEKRLHKSIKMRFLMYVLFFGTFFCFFYFGSYWYPEATLTVSGRAIEVPTEVGIRWDSGSGLNGYEKYVCPIQLFPQNNGADRTEVPLVITRTGERHPASAGKSVLLRSILIDEEQYVPAGDELPPGVKRLEDGSLLFTKDGAELHINIKPNYSVRLELQAFNHAGKVDVRLGDTRNRYDLYAPHQQRQWGGRYAKVLYFRFAADDGRFRISMPMPRYPVTMFRVGSPDDIAVNPLQINTEDGQNLEVPGFAYQQGFNYPMREFDQQLRRRFHPHRLVFQIVFAALTTWVVANILIYTRRFNGLKDIFLEKQRPLFWSMFLVGSICFAFWHISFWPGVLSNDSLEIWRAAQIPGTYLGDHPPLNVLFYLFLNQFWNNPAVVPLVQNICTSLLIAYIFFSLYRKGLPLLWLMPCYVLLVFSLPVGLYTIILWKDVPFALLTVFVGYRLASLYYDKRNNRLQVSGLEWFNLFCVTVAIAGFRHNGVLSLILVPTIIILFGIVRLRPLTLTVLCGAFIILAAYFVIAPGRFKTADYLRNQTKTYLTQALERVSTKRVTLFGGKYLGIFNVNQTRMQWDLVHLCMYGRYTYDFIRQVRWNDVYRFIKIPDDEVNKKMRRAAWALYWKSYEKPWVYFTWNPFYMLFILPLLPLSFRRLPMTAVFSLFIFMPLLALVFLDIFNWRYYYFAHLGIYFLVPLALTDLYSRRKT